MNKPLEEMSKDELEEFARKEYAFEIDKRRRLDDLVDQVKRLAVMKAKPKVEEKKGERVPVRCRNIHTGIEWEWNPLYRGNPDLEIIEWG